MMARQAVPGRLRWIGLRPARREDVVTPDAAEIAAEGLVGDHGRSPRRAVTLIQWEHLPVIAALAGRKAVAPELLRRNLAVAGLNLAAVRKGRVAVGAAVLEITGLCPPCSRMEEALGHGGYTAVRGHGGWYASVVTPGRIAIGDPVVRAD
ncbi:MOSC domain-containing protein [Rhodobacteraceae bacterium CCMM004]|nr:MOSC domain-containing protein [Rhodobacteraceae bacterium CCMM004]